MKKSKILVASLALAAVFGGASLPARAQSSPATPSSSANSPVAIGTVRQPTVVRVIDTLTLRHPMPEGSEWLKVEVIHADAVSLIVREQANGMAIHTFNFSSDLQPKMQAMLDKGGFQYGDKISILFMQGQTVALRIHGKPSKSL
jgi:hypothetical protein